MQWVRDLRTARDQPRIIYNFPDQHNIACSPVETPNIRNFILFFLFFFLFWKYYSGTADTTFPLTPKQKDSGRAGPTWRPGIKRRADLAGNAPVIGRSVKELGHVNKKSENIRREVGSY